MVKAAACCENRDNKATIIIKGTNILFIQIFSKVLCFQIVLAFRIERINVLVSHVYVFVAKIVVICRNITVEQLQTCSVFFFFLRSVRVPVQHATSSSPLIGGSDNIVLAVPSLVHVFRAKAPAVCA